MHFVKTLIYLATLLGLAMAQSMSILSPAPGTTVTPGTNFTVSLQMSNSSESIDVVAIVIGLQSCSSSTTCYPVNEGIGTLLYEGKFAPTGVLAANFSFAVPLSFASGTAQLGVINYFLVGSENENNLQFLNETLTVA
ncbi:hypothetical protein EDD16DRAFT_1611251 [Pisolithus croceorrhizus]|nr:hypothetical protein EDD16DRAFT_1611251 [Pisolithus croceorrhizus]KAI6111913.1 hypothetical protein EV401DRAFT_1987831 [Pisolithus croceorrhizus]